MAHYNPMMAFCCLRPKKFQGHCLGLIIGLGLDPTQPTSKGWVRHSFERCPIPKTWVARQPQIWLPKQLLPISTYSLIHSNYRKKGYSRNNHLVNSAGFAQASVTCACPRGFVFDPAPRASTTDLGLGQPCPQPWWWFLESHCTELEPGTRTRDGTGKQSASIVLCAVHTTQGQGQGTIVTARKRSCGKVMFLQVCVILFTGRVYPMMPCRSHDQPLYKQLHCWWVSVGEEAAYR